MTDSFHPFLGAFGVIIGPVTGTFGLVFPFGHVG
jgi:hypothetical protein